MTRMIHHKINGIIPMVLLVAFSGCNMNDDPEERTGESEAALGGELGCTTASLAGPNGGSLIASAGGATAVSPDDKYNTSGCPDQYVAEVTGMLSSCGSYVADWDQPMPTNPISCANARIQWHEYGYNGTWSGALFSMYLGGFWTGASCVWINAPGSPSGAINVASYSKIRLAVQAWEWVGGRADHKLVQVRCQ